MPSQRDKAMRFRALHETPGTFVIPNVWDGGSASVMAGLRVEARAAPSAPGAAALGELGGGGTREGAAGPPPPVRGAGAPPPGRRPRHRLRRAPPAAAG